MSTANYVPQHMATVKRSPTYDDHSSGSERKQSTSGTKKRASRAGTRSVTTLTAAQLERKRANDREAQRAIRQRTKDHIESLERQVRDLTAQLDSSSSSKMMELMRRNEELEQENAVLKARLSHAVQALGMPEGSGTLNTFVYATAQITCSTVVERPTAIFAFVLQWPIIPLFFLHASSHHTVFGLAPTTCQMGLIVFCAGNTMAGAESTGLIAATGGASSPSDRVHILSQPRRSSTGTARSVHSVPEISTAPASQPAHWQPQPQHPYTSNVPSPHIEHPPTSWSPHPSAHPQHHPVSLAVQDPSLHAVDSGNISYPSPYALDNNTRAMSYPLENTALVTSQPMQMAGYSTPTSNPSPHPSEYHRQMSAPMNPAQPGGHHAYPSPAHHGYVPQASHPGDMHLMAPASHQQPQMMGEQGQMMYHIPQDMKVEH